MTHTLRAQELDEMQKEIGNALMSCLISPNEMDRNLESANVVDGMFAIARAIDRLSRAIEAQGSSLQPATSGKRDTEQK